MSITPCPTCGNRHPWSWEEAFDKFGFDDGDGLVMTDHVADALTANGYAVTAQKWGLHNVVITSIMRDGAELIPENADVGYADPRDYLPETIIALLDAVFPIAVLVMR
jgi:hypothetical protein